jgi:hypothetical protein
VVVLDTLETAVIRAATEWSSRYDGLRVRTDRILDTVEPGRPGFDRWRARRGSRLNVNRII